MKGDPLPGKRDLYESIIKIIPCGNGDTARRSTRLTTSYFQD